MVLLVAMFLLGAHWTFAAFPTILLFTTLLRLSLNVASTRIILMEGHAQVQQLQGVLLKLLVISS